MFRHASRATLLLAFLTLLPHSGYARKHEHFGDGFSIDLDHPYDEVVKVVQEVANNGTIHGTFEYKGTHDLDGARAAKATHAFPPWTGAGTVLYKERPNTLAPENFYATNDSGTVVVRYVLQPIGANSTRLKIDAVFDADTHHGAHASNGQVENKEFEVISGKIEDLEQQQKKQQQEARVEEQQNKLQELQQDLDAENAKLDTLSAREKELHTQLEERQGAAKVQVRTATDLKAEPYNQAKVMRALPQGELVTVLLRTASWCRVQVADGAQGWIYRPALESAP
jgi:Bacterial SH3 domain